MMLRCLLLLVMLVFRASDAAASEDSPSEEAEEPALALEHAQLLRKGCKTLSPTTKGARRRAQREVCRVVPMSLEDETDDASPPPPDDARAWAPNFDT